MLLMELHLVWDRKVKYIQKTKCKNEVGKSTFFLLLLIQVLCWTFVLHWNWRSFKRFWAASVEHPYLLPQPTSWISWTCPFWAQKMVQSNSPRTPSYCSSFRLFKHKMSTIWNQETHTCTYMIMKSFPPWALITWLLLRIDFLAAQNEGHPFGHFAKQGKDVH